ncbi:hypothetical protein D4764_03G0006500 [Takifugu flavidus]|uniref:Uncharacterized protein n=1 Tax=Takifugu flavidus TaxID=433684 RepID=A0A5C6N853_9TELE|nr:hypothetical protein D4764_03G0006500 [Takifugu flavidus]
MGKSTILCSVRLLLHTANSLENSPAIFRHLKNDFSSIHPSIYPSIHPSSTAYPGSGRGGSSLSREAQTSLSPATSSSSFRGDPQAFPDQSRDIVSPACPRSSRGPPTGGTCPEHLTREVSWGHPN